MQTTTILFNELGVPTTSYKLAGWFWEIPNEISRLISVELTLPC